MGTKKPKTEVALTKKQLPAMSGKPMGRGFEEADAEAFAIPFLAVLQKLTPQADPDAEEYIKGAKPGMFMNTVTLELYESVSIIPCAYQRRFNRWAPRDAGGGFKGSFMPSVIPGMEASGVIKANEDGRLYYPLPDGAINDKKCDTLTDTRMHFCQLVQADGALAPVLVSLSRTQLKKSKQWMMLMQSRGGDMFSTVYSLDTRQEENDKGKWYGVAITVERDASEGERATCEVFYASISAGKVQVKMDNASGDE